MATGFVKPPVLANPTPPPIGESDRVIQSQLRRAGQFVRWVEAGSQLLTLLVGTLVFFLVAAFIDHWILSLGWFGRWMLCLTFMGGSGWFVITRILPLMIRAVNPAYSARAIEEATPSLKNSLLNFILLKDDHAGVKDSVMHAIQVQAASDISGVEVETTIDRAPLIRIGYILCGVMAVVALYKIASPKDPFQTAARVVAPWADLARPSRVLIREVQPGHASVYLGSTVEVTADVQGARGADAVRLIYSTADGQVSERVVVMKNTSGGNHYVGKLPAADSPQPMGRSGLQQGVQYRVEAGDAISSIYEIRVRQAPTIAVEKADLNFPAYTLKAPQSQPSGEIKALEGTRVTIHARANQPIKSAYLEFDPKPGRASETVPLQANGDTASGGFTLQLKADRTTPWRESYQVRFANEQGEISEQPVLHKLEVVADLPPEVEILQPRLQKLDLPEDGRLTIEARGVDPDFALFDLHIAAKSHAGELFRKSLLPVGAPQSQASGKFEFIPADYNLKAGTVVTYQAVAIDNRRDPVSGQPQPGRAQTPEYTINIIPSRKQNPNDAQNPDKQNPNNAPQNNPDQPKPGENPQQPKPNENKANPQQPNDQRSNDQSKPMPGENNPPPMPGENPAQQEQNGGNKNQQPNGNDQQPQPNKPQPKKPDDKQPPNNNSSQQQKGGSGEGKGNSSSDGSGNNAQPGSGGGQPNNNRQPNDQSPMGGAQQNNGGENSGQNQPGGPNQAGGQSQPGGNNAGGDQSNNGQENNQNNSEGEFGGNSNVRPGNNSGQSGKPQHDGDKFEKFLEELKKQHDQEKKNGSGGQQAPNPQPNQLKPDSQSGKPGDQNNGSGTGQNSPDQGPTEQQLKELEKMVKDHQAKENGDNQGPNSQEQKAPPNGQPAGSSQQQPGQPNGQPMPGANGEPNQGTGQPMNPMGQGNQAKPEQGKPEANPQNGGAQNQQNPKPNEGGSPQGPPRNEGEPQQPMPKSGEQKNPGAAQNSNPGNGGEQSKDPTGSAQQNDQKQGKPKESSGSNEGNSKTNEASAPGQKPNNSNTKGGSSGDQKGQGKQGAGTSGGAPGNDSAGGSTPGEEGAGKANEQGKGETGNKAGKGPEAAGKTGQSGGKNPGEGSSTKPGEKGNETGKGGESSKKPGEKGKGEPGGSSGGGDRAGPAGKPTGDGSGGDRSGQGITNKSDDVADEANLNYTKRVTDLVLQSLRDQEHNPDPELAKRTGLTPQELQEFARRWNQLKKDAEADPAKARELDEALRSLGMRDPKNRRRSESTTDKQRDLRDAGGRTQAPSKYREQFEQFRKSSGGK
ncbi:hypothetical protein [Anatilimnocola floriformis]|uniref:hypothetical protein n=1 Tax=Anatilimnocola floriformis TaxID=2948575 RepID=UPI0020C2C2AD|nr:hypothetical protein [Anatilimnocola floriformis]